MGMTLSSLQLGKLGLLHLCIFLETSCWCPKVLKKQWYIEPGV